MNQTQRHAEIEKLLIARQYLSIDALVEHFKVTPQTVRRDLNIMAEKGLLHRVHGGAGQIGSGSGAQNTPYQQRKAENLIAKERIAEAVAAMIPDGSSLFINIGTTAEVIAEKLLGHSNLRIVTNNIHVATILSGKEDFSVIIAAGEVRFRDGGIIGEATCDFINQFRMDYGVIGISGISEDGALLDFDFREVKVSQAILKHSRHVILAADAAKFGRHAMVEQGHLSQVDHLVTDESPPKSLQTIIDTHDLQLTIVTKSNKNEN
ncbi:DeoR family transcriptional regulator [Alteromonas oceanisediminis]|uniref:DeoR family transcriptional regulator n=1 Tax=Alteromonas oceanisediminis TaxID=2836180 RepID=UPI001BDAE034|nr:DeoR family transcriptional regulator [Alteromonas oceanisediminis]MBT0587723.1 DeoR family transcriptional regulator [Alteromonas oceanisediminis]